MVNTLAFAVLFLGPKETKDIFSNSKRNKYKHTFDQNYWTIITILIDCQSCEFKPTILAPLIKN
jgi:hypothetical protein